jgi:hypothetical protein
MPTGLLSAVLLHLQMAASGLPMRKWFAKHHESNKRQGFQMV